MKKLIAVAAAIILGFGLQAQIVLGLQGGYHTQKTTAPDDNLSLLDYSRSNAWHGGLQVGYMVTPKLYVGVQGGLAGTSATSYDQLDSILFEGMMRPIENHEFNKSRSGWSVAPVVRYELIHYGNMHFNIMLSAQFAKMGYTTTHELYNTPFRNNGELRDIDAVEDSISDFSLNISLRPTLTYEFSQHLSAELSLDFFSIGYAATRRSFDNRLDSDQKPFQHKTTALYAGLNTFMQTFDWESPLLRLGFNYTF